MQLLTFKHIIFATAVLGFVAAGTGYSSASSGFAQDAPVVPGLRDAGPLAASAPIHVGFLLNLQHAGELDRDVELVSTKGLPQYRHFLSNAQWNAYFAPSPLAVRAVSLALEHAGFRIESVAANRGIVTAQAPSAVVARYFATHFRRVEQDGAVRYLNAAPAILPAELRPFVAGVTGLDDIQAARTQPHPSHSAAAAGIAGPLTGPDKGYAPAVFADGFDYPSRHGFDGSGGTVGIDIGDQYLDSDTATFLKYFKIKQTGVVRRVSVDGGYHGKPGGEATLDVETIASLAPGVNIDVYQYPEYTTRNILDSFNRIVADNVVDAFSNSWYGCEITEPVIARNEEKVIFEQAALKGITVISMSGNQGAYAGCGRSISVAADASNPYDTAVGGVHVDVNPATGAFLSLSGSWPVARSSGPFGSGGGVSVVWPMPPYQSKVAVNRHGRNVPDLALAGDVEYSYYYKGCWCGPDGGTDFSAAAFNALLEETNQVIGRENHVPILRAGFVNPALYAAYGTFGSRVFTDITQGNSGIPKVGPGFQAGKGYDLVTGLGTPLGMALADAL